MCPLAPGLRRFSLALLLFLTTAAVAATKHVDVGNIFFRDVESGTSTTSISVGDTIEWDWVPNGGTHTTTSGTCGSVSCAPDDPTWDAPIDPNHTKFSRTFNTPGVFPYFCVPHQSFMQGTVIVTADFTVAVSDAAGGSMGTIFPGQQTVFNGSVVGTTGYNKTVTLSCQSGAPALPSPCTPNNPQTGTPTGVPTFNFTITAGANSTGHYSFSAQGTDGTLTHLFPDLNFDVVDFGIGPPSPASVTAFANSTSTSTSVTLTAVGSLPNSVTVSCESNGAGATCTPAFYNPAQGAPISASVSLTVPANTPPQDSNVVLDATSGTNAGPVTKNQTLGLHVVQFTPAPFTPNPVTIGAGNLSNAATTHLTASTNFVNPGTVTMACTAGLPAGGACIFPQSGGAITSFPYDQQVQVSIPFNTPAANPNLTVTATGSSGGAVFAQSQQLTVHVPAPALSLGAPSPASVTMANSSFSAPVTVQITPTNLAGVVTPSCGNLPTGVSCLFSPATINLNGSPASFAVIFKADGSQGAIPGTTSNITINGSATINGTPVNASVGLTQLAIAAPASSTIISSSLAAMNAATNSGLINVGDPNLTVTATVNNTGSNTYSAAVWEVSFSNPIVLVASSNPNCSQVLPTAVACNIGDVTVGSGKQYSFKVAPLFERSVVTSSLLTSPTVGSGSLSGNMATAPAVQVRPRPLARRGLVPKTP